MWCAAERCPPVGTTFAGATIDRSRSGEPSACRETPESHACPSSPIMTTRLPPRLAVMSPSPAHHVYFPIIEKKQRWPAQGSVQAFYDDIITYYRKAPRPPRHFLHAVRSLNQKGGPGTAEIREPARQAKGPRRSPPTSARRRPAPACSTVTNCPLRLRAVSLLNRPRPRTC